MNPYRERAQQARAKADILSEPTAHDKAMREAFPLGAGYGGGRSAGKRMEARLTRATKAVRANALANYLEAKADRYDRGEPERPLRKPKVAPAPKEVIPDAERLFIGNLGGGVMYCDRAIEKSGDYKHLAFLPSRGHTYDALEWKAKRIPAFLRESIEVHAAAEKVQGEKRAAEDQVARKQEQEWRKANGWS